MNVNNALSASIHDYIVGEIVNDPTLTVGENDDLLLAGVLDSVSVVKLVAYIENLHEIKIPPEDILLEHFGTLKQIDDYLATRIV